VSTPARTTGDDATPEPARTGGPVDPSGEGVADGALEHVERELGLFLRRARASSARLAARVHPDLEPAAYPLLAHIAQHPDVRAREIATHIGVGKGTMSRQLARLEELALVERRPDPEDSRGQLIRLTAEGTRRVDGARVARRRFLGSALGAWSDDEIAHLAEQLARLNADLDTARRRTD
jgi:DNA-binding MarR family transcriptional regulator